MCFESMKEVGAGFNELCLVPSLVCVGVSHFGSEMTRDTI